MFVAAADLPLLGVATRSTTSRLIMHSGVECSIACPQDRTPPQHTSVPPGIVFVLAE